MRRFKLHSLILAAAASLVLISLNGCSDGPNNPDAVGPPIPDSPRAIKSAGTPLFLFGGGSNRGAPGTSDKDYQEYLLWKEWQEYQKYQEWLKSQGNDQPLESDN